MFFWFYSQVLYILKTSGCPEFGHFFDVNQTCQVQLPQATPKQLRSLMLLIAPFPGEDMFFYRVVKGGGSKGRGFPNIP